MTGIASMTTVRARPVDVPTLSHTLAAAFQDDPVLSWIVPGAERRRALLPAVFEAFAQVYLSHDEAHLVGDGAGAALWAPPGVEPMSEAQERWFGERQVEILGEGADRAFALGERFEQHHPEQPCWYLQFMGVLPEQQGHGLGSHLLTTVLQRGDADGTPCYLEATSLDNRRLYERHGFEAVGEIVLPQGPAVWPMWRAPDPSGVAAVRPRDSKTDQDRTVPPPWSGP
jgi:ribosomal protein S18 acetylase RimI-like enzyme